MRTPSSLQFVAPLALAVLTAGFGQTQTISPVALTVTDADFAAAANPVPHPFSGAGLATANGAHRAPGNAAGALSSGSSSTAPGQQGQIFYPLDVSNPHNGPTIDAAQHHPIYVNEPSSYWPDVATFLEDLGTSQFIHILDQYVKSSKDNRYTLGTQFNAALSVPPDNIIRPPQIFALLHAAALQGGSGYANIYHIFVPQGTGVCYFGDCYIPGNSAATTFCAFHDAVQFSDSVGEVIFTMEPYLDLPQCSALPGTPNGQLADTTYTFLSHEVFEAITDPDLAGWYIHDITFAWGAEIADNCQRRPHPNVTLNGHLYNLQAEYSNQFHGCAYSLAPDGAWSD